MLLALPLVAGAAHADSLPGLLGQYRAAPGCQGPAYQAAVNAVDRALLAYHVAPLTAPLSVQRGRRAAAGLYGLAAVEAAKGCTALAFETYRFLLRRFDGPAFADWQRRAVHDLHAL